MASKATFKAFAWTVGLGLGLAAVAPDANAASVTTELRFHIYNVTVSTDPVPAKQLVQPFQFTTDYTGWLDFGSTRNSWAWVGIDGDPIERFRVSQGTMGGFAGAVRLDHGVIKEGNVTFTGRASSTAPLDSYSVLLASASPGNKDLGGGIAENGQYTPAFTLTARTYMGTLTDPNNDGLFGLADVSPWLAYSPMLQGGLTQFNIIIDPVTGISAACNGDMYTSVSTVPAPTAVWAGVVLLGLLAAAGGYRRWSAS